MANTPSPKLEFNVEVLHSSSPLLKPLWKKSLDFEKYFAGAILSLFFFPVGQAVLCNKKTQSNNIYDSLILLQNEIMDWIEGRISSTESDFGFIDGNVFFTQNACPG